MNVRSIALTLLLAVSLTGCASLTCTNTATIVIDGLPRHSCILIDPSLKPEVNETCGTGLFWDTKQRVVINASGPLKLIPTIPKYPVVDKVGTTHTATVVVNGLPNSPKNYPILIDPCLVPKLNETHGAWSISSRGNDINQRVVIHSSVPLRLVPASPKEAAKLMAVEIGFQPSQSSSPH